jgi:hypothetical protein
LDIIEKSKDKKVVCQIKAKIVEPNQGKECCAYLRHLLLAVRIE